FVTLLRETHCRQRGSAWRSGPERTPTMLPSGWGEAGRSQARVRWEPVLKLGAVQLFQRNLHRSERLRVVHLERDGKESPVLKAFGGRTRSSDMPRLWVQHAHAAGELGLGDEREPGRVVP